jgi:predicted nucleic acid-binding protein
MVVIDTNVLAYLLLVGNKTEEAQALLVQDGDWRSDYFVLVEFTNVLVTYIRTRGLPREQAAGLLSEAEGLLGDGLQFAPHNDALTLASQYSVSAYDARFLAVARSHDARLVTEDAKLRAAAPALTVSLAEALSRS